MHYWQETLYICPAMTKPLPNIRKFDQEELKDMFQEMGHPSYRADQVWDWLWKKGVDNFDEMSNLGKALRSKLREQFVINKVSIHSQYASKDGTRKYAFEVSDGHKVEGVLIPTPKRLTACISSQVGCSLSCKFCATGFLPLSRNLFFYEIYDQVQLLRKEAAEHFGRNLTNIVYMGMGEPLLNFKNVVQSIRLITMEEGLGMAPKRITLSTAGIAKMIRKLADEELRIEFALSLHAANDQKRSEVMPINDSNSLEALTAALQYYYEKTGSRITYEYCIFKGVNDSIQDAEELAAFSKIVPSKINVIEYNPIEEAEFVNTSGKRMNAFIEHLASQKVIVNVRRSRGRDIDGACGQLALREEKK